MSKKVCVVTRQLPGMDPVAFLVITAPKQLPGIDPVSFLVPTAPDYDVAILEQYYTKIAKQKIQEFQNNFVEFHKAEFYITFVDTITS